MMNKKQQIAAFIVNETDLFEGYEYLIPCLNACINEGLESVIFEKIVTMINLKKEQSRFKQNERRMV